MNDGLGRVAPWLFIAFSPLLALVSGSWWVAAVLVPVDVVVALLEIATRRQWTGFWGEKVLDENGRYVSRW